MRRRERTRRRRENERMMIMVWSEPKKGLTTFNFLI